MRFKTQRTLVRPFCEADAADVYACCSDPAVAQAAGWAAHASAADSAAHLAQWMEENRRFAIVWAQTGQVIGHIAVYPDSEEGRPDTRELGCALRRGFQRRGIMTEVIRRTLEELRGAGIRDVWACCFKDNAASRGMIEKLGFEFQQVGSFFSPSLNREFESREYRMRFFD